MPRRQLTPLLALIPALLLAQGCSQQTTTPADTITVDYNRPLPRGHTPLRKITDTAHMPDTTTAWNNRDIFLGDAMDRSIEWYDAPSSQQWFPVCNITHEQAKASVIAMRQLMRTTPNSNKFNQAIQERFDVYESIGCDDEGTVLFTGYYAPDFHASRTRSTRFNTPLYTRPDDLVTDQRDGTPLGRRLPDGTIVSYPPRRTIEHTRMLKGTELVWLEDPLAAYIVHVNGSAKLRMDDGTILYVGYAGKTDRKYTGLGRTLVAEKLLREDELSLPAIRRAWKKNPAQIESMIHRNENYVFFQEYEGDTWPAGSLGVPVTPERSLATDKTIFPRGAVVLVDTDAVTLSRGSRSFVQFMVDQDTGGAINAPGRADLFMGIGPTAEILAGGQYAEGKLYYFFLKPREVQAMKSKTVPMAGAN
jgi:membrane-bound lytic murein transglycosylase A